MKIKDFSACLFKVTILCKLTRIITVKEQAFITRLVNIIPIISLESSQM